MAGYIGSKVAVVSSGAERKKVFTATSGQTSFTGLSYTVNNVHVFQNGVRLVDGTDYTATNGNSITLTVGAATDDQVVVVSYNTFQTSDTVSASAGGTFSNAVTIDADGATVLTVDRATSDGTIIDVQKSGSSVGSIGATSGYLTVTASGGSDAGAKLGNSAIFPCNTDGSDRDAGINLGLSTVRWKDLYLSGGVYLGGTGSANHLDDYEEGTWTPAFNDYSGSYVLQGGHYTKVGRIVTIAGTAYGNSGTNASGAFKITGLPFPAQSSGDTDYHPVFVNVERAVRNLSDLDYMSMITPSGTEIWFFRDNGNTGGMTQLVWGTDFDSNSRFRFNASYITSS